MSAQAVFPGKVDASGHRIEFDEPHKYIAARQKRAGRRVVVVLRTPKSKRSLEMNAYLHCKNGPFRLLAEHCGEDVADMKYALAGECFGWVYSATAGREVPVKPHTSEWTVEESAYFVDWVIPWAVQKFGVVIPLPNEALIDDEAA